MAGKITAEKLQRLCGPSIESKRHAAQLACDALGGLARWWLKPEVLRLAFDADDPIMTELANPARPDLSEDRGSCWILFLLCGRLSGVRPAVILPLQWVRGCRDAESLPPKLHDLADLVRDQVSRIAGNDRTFGNPESWGLQPDPRLGLERRPLGDDLFETVESGWGALTSGLIAAVQGLAPRTSSFISVAWDERIGPKRVDGLPEKLDTAIAWGATAFGAVVSQRNEVEELLPADFTSTIRVAALSIPVTPNPWISIKDFLPEYTREPAIPEPDDLEGFERCRQYWRNLRPFADDERRFYHTHLYESIIHRCRRTLHDDHTGLQPTHFITIVSKSPELAVLTASVVGAPHCLLLHTREDELRQAAMIGCESLQQRGIQSDFQDFVDGPPMVESIASRIREFTREASPTSVVLDLKPGTKKMSYAMARAAREGNWLFNLETLFLRNDGRVDPGSERPELWQETRDSSPSSIISSQ